MHGGVKAGGDSSEAKSDICRSDTYHAISNLCHLCREMSYILVITNSSFSSACVAEPEEEAICCSSSPVPVVPSFPCSFPVHSA